MRLSCFEYRLMSEIGSSMPVSWETVVEYAQVATALATVAAALTAVGALMWQLGHSRRMNRDERERRRREELRNVYAEVGLRLQLLIRILDELAARRRVDRRGLFEGVQYGRHAAGLLAMYGAPPGIMNRLRDYTAAYQEISARVTRWKPIWLCTPTRADRDRLTHLLTEFYREAGLELEAVSPARSAQTE